MSEALTIHRRVHFHAGRRQGGANENRQDQLPNGRIPRVAKLLALAITMEQLVDSGQVADYAQLARIRKVSRARITQITSLLLLAPDIQESILFLPPIHSGRDPIPIHSGRDPITERQLRPIAAEPDWAKQRKMWSRLQSKSSLEN